MTAMPAAQTMTAKEFLELPPPAHGRPWNLVEGELVVNEPTVTHQIVGGRLFNELTNWGHGRTVLPIDVQLDQRNVYAPDVLWYAPGRGPARDGRPPYPMPDLAIEVRSPSTWRYDIGAKKSGYEREGLPELWLVDTAASEVLVFRRAEPETPTFDVSLQLDTTHELGSPLLPGFALSVERLFGER